MNKCGETIILHANTITAWSYQSIVYTNPSSCDIRHSMRCTVMSKHTVQYTQQQQHKHSNKKMPIKYKLFFRKQVRIHRMISTNPNVIYFVHFPPAVDPILSNRIMEKVLHSTLDQQRDS